jgi:hypothetical protein
MRLHCMVLNKQEGQTNLHFISNFFFNIVHLVALLFNEFRFPLSTVLMPDRLCGLVVSIEDYKHRGPRFDSRALLRIFLRELGLERGLLCLVIG